MSSVPRRVPSKPIAIAPSTADIVPAQRVSQYVRALRRRWWIVATVTAAAVFAALAVSLTSEKEFDATSKVLLTNSEPVDTILLTERSRSNDPERDVNTDVALVTLGPVAKRVQRRLRLPLSTADLVEKVTARTAGATNVISITVRDPSPARAQAIANAFAAEYVSFRHDAVQSQYERAAAGGKRALAAMTPAQRNSVRGRALTSSLQALQTAAKLVTGGLQVAEPAALPTEAATPRPKLSVAIALVLGLCFAALFAIGLDFADRRLRDESDVEELFGLPILARIPAIRRWRESDDGMTQEEAYAAMAVNLRLRDLEAGQQTVMVASAEAETGKTSVTIGVARALAGAGQRVMVIECDLRRPRLASYIGLQASGGLASVLGRSSLLDSELVEVDVLSGAAADPNLHVASFDVLPAGSVVSNPHTALSSPRMQGILAAAESKVDMVLLDTPALAFVSDALDLAGNVDTCVLVVRLNRSTKAGVRRVLGTLQEVGVDVAGIVVTSAKADRVNAGDYLARRPLPGRAQQTRDLVVELARRRRRAADPSP